MCRLRSDHLRDYEPASMGARLFRCAALISAAVLSACPTSNPEVVFFTATPSEIDPGQSVQLAWDTKNAATCGLEPGQGTFAPRGATLVTPTVTTAYTLNCDGALAFATVNVRVPSAVTIDSFTASTSMTTPDSPVTLTWTTTGASSCSLSPGGNVAANGTQSVQPAQTTTYTLTCGAQTSSVTVTVLPAGTITEPTNVVITAQDGALSVAWQQLTGSANIYFAEVAGITQTNVETLTGGIVHRRVTSPFVITGLVNGRTYYLRISAVSGALESTLTAEQSGVPVGLQGGNDPYFTQQWHLASGAREGVNVSATWAADVKGQGVYAAIVDDGMDVNHEDLRPNVAVGLSHDYTSQHADEYMWHGTCVSGLIGARDLNNIGVRGVAPRVSMMVFALLDDVTSQNEYDAMTRQKSIVSVSNNSWGDAYDQTGQLTFADSEWLRGVKEGATTGRNGLGTVYFWASGNGADPQGQYVDDSNYDSQANSRYVIAVGGIGKDGVRPLYAEPGANVLIVAPTEGDDLIGTTTTDVTGTDGYNSGREQGEHANVNYSATMSGTSGSTPVAAAVGALVLQVRPQLSYRDVRRVLAHSARKADATNAGWSNNGAGLHVNHEYGFGVVDADAAVALARTITPVGAELTVSGTASPGLAIPDNNATGISSDIVISNSNINRVEVIEVEVTIPHMRTADLEVVLSRAGNAGASSTLHTAHRCERDRGQEVCSDIDAYVFTTVRNLDEPADGTWTLTVRDRRNSNTGTLATWAMRIYGN